MSGCAMNPDLHGLNAEQQVMFRELDENLLNQYPFI